MSDNEKTGFRGFYGITIAKAVNDLVKFRKQIDKYQANYKTSSSNTTTVTLPTTSLPVTPPMKDFYIKIPVYGSTKHLSPLSIESDPIVANVDITPFSPMLEIHDVLESEEPIKHYVLNHDVQPPLEGSDGGGLNDGNSNSSVCVTLEDTGVVLLHALSYLKVDELLKLARVNKYFNKVAMDPGLWSVVKLEDCKVHDWEACIDTLCKRNTKRLDLRGMLLPDQPEYVSTMWQCFFKAISRMSSLEEIDLCCCDADILNSIAVAYPTLKVLNASFTNSRNIGFRNISELTQLKKLVIKGINCEEIEHFELKASYEHLTTLSLTNIEKLKPSMIGCIRKMKKLEYLGLGECTNLFADKTFDDILKQLTNLKALRLETVKGLKPKYEIFSVIKELPHLTTLELINIDIDADFDKMIRQCTNIERLLLMPDFFCDAEDGFEDPVPQSNKESSEKNENRTKPNSDERAVLPLSRPNLAKKRRSEELNNDVLLSVRDDFKKPSPPDDRYDLIGKSIAMRIRSLEQRQRLIVEKKINDLLFEAEMGMFNMPTSSYNPEYLSSSSSSASLPNPSAAAPYDPLIQKTATAGFVTNEKRPPNG